MTFEDGNNVPLRHDYTNKVIAVKSTPDPSSMTASNGAYFSAPGMNYTIRFHSIESQKYRIIPILSSIKL